MDCEHMLYLSKLSCTLILNMEIAFAWVLYTNKQIAFMVTYIADMEREWYIRLNYAAHLPHIRHNPAKVE